MQQNSLKKVGALPGTDQLTRPRPVALRLSTARMEWGKTGRGHQIQRKSKASWSMLS